MYNYENSKETLKEILEESGKGLAYSEIKEVLENLKELDEDKHEILDGIYNYQDLDANDYIELIEVLANERLNLDGYDYIELAGLEIRVILGTDIDEIWTEELENLLQDNYNIPDFLVNYIDWDKWVRDCKLYDGEGHHFSSYDGSEHNTENFWYFRTN